MHLLRFRFHWPIAVLIGLACLFSAASADEPIGQEHSEKMAAGLKLFREQVRGILITRCLECHGGEEIEGDFDLSTRERLLEGGAEGDAVKLEKSGESRLVQLIKHEVAPEMPYEEAKLEAAQIAAIEKWIDLGAPYDKPLKGEGEHETPWTERIVDPAAKTYWAFQPLKIVEPPAHADSSWTRTPIDQFVLAKLNEKQLAPNGPAEAQVIIRRLYYDLIGLPPAPEELAQWTVRLTAPQKEGQQAESKLNHNAVSALVVELLASPHYGERWGRHWLDVARFAESHGFEQDYDRPHAYHYRDFVIKALNQDMPYDQFVKWQIAGDEIAPEDPLAMMATGFLGAGVFPTQLTEKEFESARYDELDDMVGTLGTSMLGMTIGCARCHDHKFDPIPQADYYRMVSAFTTTIRSEIDLELSSPEERAKAKQEHQAKMAKAKTELERFKAEQLSEQFETFVKNFKADSEPAQPWAILDVMKHESAHGTKFEKQADGSLLQVGTVPAKDTYAFVAKTSDTNVTAVRLEALTHKSLPRSGPGLAGNGNFCLSDFRVAARAIGSSDAPAPVKIASARVTHQQDGGQLSAPASFDGDSAKTGWAVDRGGIGKDQAAVFAFDQPVAFDAGIEFTFTLVFDHPNTKHAMGRPRLSVTGQNPQQVAIQEGEAASGVPESISQTLIRLAANEKVADADHDAARDWFAATLPQFQKLKGDVDKLNAQGPTVAGGQKVKVMVTSEGLPKMKHHADGRGFTHFYPKSFYLKRGDANQKQGEAPASYLQVLMRSDAGTAESSAAQNPVALAGQWEVEPPSGWRTSYRRRSLANWMTDTELGAGHLLARVIVNRVWHLHFGRGLVPTPNDFGNQGEAPSHPELLDWLAADFIEHGWKLKRLHQQILTSSAYLQSSDFDDAKAKVDPDNRLLWRFTPRRLEAEIIRDAMLAASGQLDSTMFGKGTLSEGMKRRSVYFFIKRSKLIPMMQLFDQPEPLVSQGNRPATTIAPQALMFMNNPHVRGYAGALANRIAPKEDATIDDAIERGYLIAVSRQPSKAELADNIAFVQSQTESYQEENKPNARQLALADFCQVLFSLNEFVFIE